MDNHLPQPIAKIHSSGLHSGRSKPRLRLLSMRPSNGNSSILPDYTTVSKLNDQSQQLNNLSAAQNVTVHTEQKCTSKNQKPSRLSRFVKRFSMTFIPTPVTLEENHSDVVNQIEVKRNSINQFDFNHWRRRKSMGRSKYNQPDRDRSPLCAVHSIEHGTATSTELSDKENKPVLQSLNFQAIESPLVKLVSKRRTSLSRWFPHSVKNPRNSIKLTSTPSVSNSTRYVTSSKRCPNELSHQDDTNETVIESVISKKVKKSYFPCTYQTVPIVQDTMSKLATPNDSAGTVFENDSCNPSFTSNNLPVKFPESSMVTGSTFSSSFSDSQCSFEFKHDFLQTDFNDLKPWFTSAENRLDGSICQRCCSSSGASIFSDWEMENVDPVLIKSRQKSPCTFMPSNSMDFLNREETLQRKPVLNGSTDQICGDHNYLSQNSCQSLSKSSKKLVDLCATEYGTVDKKLMRAGRLRNSVNRMNRKRILMAGTTLFNRNPSEGINYLIKHGIIAYHPISIARFLYSDQRLNRQAIGEYFGQISDVMAAKVLKEFLGFIDMKGREVDEALRSVLSYFHPSGESQKIAFLMQQFQEVYVAQNLDRVQSQFQSPATIEVLAYSVLLLHTDLHNPNVRRLGKRMSQSDFIMNNRGIDSDHNIQTPILEGIYKRISETQFKTLPDPSDRMRVLDTILTGHLKTENFVQRHRRFVGWAFVQQLEKIVSRPIPNKSHTHWRYLFLFNDILVIARPTNMARVRPDHVLNKAAHAAVADIGSLRLATSRLSTERQHGPDSSSVNSDSSDQLSEAPRKVDFSSEPCSDLGPCQVKTVLPLLDLRVLVFETQCYRYGVQLCSSNGPVASFNMLSYQSRQQLVYWLHESITEMQELQVHQKQLETERTDKVTQGTLKNISQPEKIANDSNR